MKKSVLSLTVFVVLVALFFAYGFSENGPFSHSDASNTNFAAQEQFLLLSKQSAPLTLDNGGWSTEVMATNPDTICYKGPIPAYPSGFFGHGSDWLGDTLYIAGGSATGTASVAVYRYSFSGDNWTAGRDMPVAKTGGKLVRCGSALYYIGGGSALGAGGGTAPTLKYTPSTGWEQVAPIPSVTVGNTAENWGDSVIFCIAGGWTEYYRGIQVYRPGSNSWSRAIDSLPAGMGRRAHASGLVGNKLFVSCGYSGTFRNDTQIGTIGANANIITWTTAPLINCRAGSGMSRPGGVGIDGYFYVIGCETSPAPAQQDSIFRFNVNTNTWEVPLKGRGTGAASNYWGAISAQVVGGRTNIYIPGGNVTGTTTWGFYVARSGGCSLVPPPPPASDSVLVMFHDTTVTGGLAKRMADRDSVMKYLPGMISKYKVLYFNQTSVLPSLANYSTIILVETSFDNSGALVLSPSARTDIKAWLTSGTPTAKKCLLQVGGDQGYNYDRTGGSGLDTAFSRSYCGFIYRVDSGMPSPGTITGVLADIGNTRTIVSPSDAGYYPDGCSPTNGGLTLYKYGNHSALDTLAGISRLTAGYLTVSSFQDPRYFTGGNLKPWMAALIAYAKTNGAILTNATPLTSIVADKYSLSQNYPNPFNPTTKISFTIPANGFVSLKVYNITGQEVMTLVNENMHTGAYSVDFNGAFLSSGVYFYRLESANFVETKKMMLVK